ncbi:helix-turn-helix domain-containing protein [Bacillaceae bacterium Marseille-Q3522]|nr:helix-turn-helix domain-containing protein [Bacillaceae bacterium Marseille-Q3522]
MNLKELDAFFRKEDEIEAIQKSTGELVNVMGTIYDNIHVPKIPGETLFSIGNIYIGKHRRYSGVPEHTHDFLEMNYMYSGNCTQYIDGSKVELHEKDLLMLDKDVVQKIEWVGKNDILINILIKDESISTDIIPNLASTKNLVTDFMVNASHEKNDHTNFILFSQNNDTVIDLLIKNLILVYFGEHSFKIKSLNLNLSLILLELSNIYEKKNLGKLNGISEEIVDILSYIDSNYKVISLKSLADKFGYNKDYLSNKLKKETGKSFRELLNKKRFSIAEELLLESDCSIEEIAETVGYIETSSLFKLFKKFTDKTPSEYREKM